MTKSASDDTAAIGAVLTALGQVIGTTAMEALMAEVERAQDRQAGVAGLALTIARPDASGEKILPLPAEVAPIVNWLLCFDQLSIGVVATILHDFGIVVPDGHGLLAVHPATAELWRELSSVLPPGHLPGISLLGFDFGPTARDDLRFSARQRMQHANALHGRMSD